MRKKIAIFIILCSSYFLWTAVPVQAKMEPDPTEKELAAKQERANALFTKGRDHFTRKELDKAEAELKACLEIFPGYAHALFYLAQVDYLKGDFGQALAGIQKAKEAYAASAGANSFNSPQHRKALLEARKQKEEEIVFLEETLNTDFCKTDHEKEKLPEKIQQCAGRSPLSTPNSMSRPEQNLRPSRPIILTSMEISSSE